MQIRLSCSLVYFLFLLSYIKLRITTYFFLHRKFGIECSAVNDAIASQIKKWNGPSGCEGGGEKCLYVVWLLLFILAPTY